MSNMHRHGESDDIDFSESKMIAHEKSIEQQAAFDKFNEGQKRHDEFRKNFYKTGLGKDARKDILSLDKDGSMAASLRAAGFDV